MKRFSILIVLCILLFALFDGCSKSADEYYTEGKELIKEKETVDKGLKILAKFEKKYPDHAKTPEVILARAMALQGEKRYDEADKAYTVLMEKYSSSDEAEKGMFLLGYMYYEDVKDNDKSLEILKKFIAGYKDSDLITSAEILIENIGLPVEEWSTVKKISTVKPQPDSAGSEK